MGQISPTRGEHRGRIALVLLAIEVGVVLALVFAVLLTQEDIARDVERAARSFVTIPRAHFVLAMLGAVAATTVSYVCNIENSVEHAGQSRCLYGGGGSERKYESDAHSPASREVDTVAP